MSRPMTLILGMSLRRRRERLAPMKPAAPVTSIVLFLRSILLIVFFFYGFVGLEVADVVAGGGHEVGVEWGVAGEPGGEGAGGVGAAAVGEGFGDAADVGGAVDVEWWDGKVAFGVLGFLFVGGDEPVGVAGGDAGCLLFVEFGFGVAHDAGGAFGAGEVDEALEAEVEEVVAGGDEEVVVDAEGVDGEFDVGYGAEAVVVVGGAVVENDDWIFKFLFCFPVVEVIDEFMVADNY